MIDPKIIGFGFSVSILKFSMVTPVVPHKAVAEVSEMANYRRSELV